MSQPLPYCQVAVLNNRVAEITFNEGIELQVHHLQALNKYLLAILTSPYGMLINKKNSYSYAFDTQRFMGKSEGLGALAVVTHDAAAKVNVHLIKNMPRKHEFNMEIFDNYQSAFSWLEQQLDELRQTLPTNKQA